MKLAVLLLVIAVAFTSIAQETYDIKHPENDLVKKCGDCIGKIRSRPNEVGWGFQVDDDYTIYFTATSVDWFFNLIKKSNDGIAVDIVTKDLYDCSNEKAERRSWAAKGELLPPVYQKEIKNNGIVSPEGYFIVPIGVLPEKYRNKEYELNFIVLINKYYCYYQTFYELDRSMWDLLDMGLYMDTLAYRSNVKSMHNGKENYIFHNKRLKFEIPFERNKSNYSAEDIKPLYDSLDITDYNIQTVEIRAYSSVEGTEEANVKLQEARAQSIIEALRSYQTSLPIEKVNASENWVEFYASLVNSPFSAMATLSKEQVKERLMDKKLREDLEPYFAKQRKAIVILDLVKKSRVDNLSESQIVAAFKKAISDKNIQEALEIQTSVYNKIIDNQLPGNLASKLEIPNESEFGFLLNNQTAFKYFIDEFDLITAYNEFKALLDYAPNNGKIRYNLAALTFDVIKLGLVEVDPVVFEKSIKDLSKYKIPGNLIKRMMVNYNIMMSEYYLMTGQFALKDKALKYIYSNYKYLPNTEKDILSLAKYFGYYSRLDWSEKLVLPYVTKVDVDEDLLFYYVNLTMIDEKNHKKSKYRNIMLNAISINKNRFCTMFNSLYQGGVSFQLLEMDFLRDTYCESCGQ